jgi:hypothetical protein
MARMFSDTQIERAITREQIEAALDGRKLWVAIQNGNYWLARRSGKTRTWKTRPDNFRIPFKYGFKGNGALDESDRVNFGTAWPAYYVISDEKPVTR